MMPPNPMGAAAREAMNMSKESGNKAFQNIALVSVGLMAVASASHVLIELLRALDRKHERAHEKERWETWQEREHHRSDRRDRDHER